MCGILGAINHDFSNTDLAVLKHRGPDDSGIETFSVNEHDICLGQARLSIIDLSPAGHQPMISEDGNYAIIFNGEIYNHQDLRNRLKNKISFKGHSDTESILYYIIENGIEGIKDFNGIFAISFLDIRAKLMYLARDPFGVKPLYLFQKQNKIIFSSEMKPIEKLIGKTTLNKDALASMLRVRYNFSPETMLNEISKVKPGHYLKIHLNESVYKEEYAYIGKKAKKNPIIATGKKTEIIKEYGIQLENAIGRQLLSDVEVGIFLSGGVDSAVVASLAQKHSSTKLKAFTIGFEGEHEEDEIKDAAETAKILGLEHYYERITFDDFLGLVKKCAEIVEEPLGTTSMIPMYYLSRLASQTVKVVLTGQGADEPLGGYARYKLELLRDKLPGFVTKLNIPLTSSFAKNDRVLRGIKSIGIKDEITRFLISYEVFTDNEIKELIGINDPYSFERIKYYYNLLDCQSQPTSVERMMAIDTRMNLADDLLNYTDKITMRFGLECRVPMLDLELVDFIQQLPVAYKLNLKHGKIIHKEFAKQLLPDEIVHRKKKGFSSPAKKWFKEESSVIRDILLSNGSTFSKYFNNAVVENIIAQHEKGFDKERQIFLLLSTYYFLESVNNL